MNRFNPYSYSHVQKSLAMKNKSRAERYQSRINKKLEKECVERICGVHLPFLSTDELLKWNVDKGIIDKMKENKVQAEQTVEMDNNDQNHNTGEHADTDNNYSLHNTPRLEDQENMETEEVLVQPTQEDTRDGATSAESDDVSKTNLTSDVAVSGVRLDDVSGMELIPYVSSSRSEPDDVSEEDVAVPRTEWYNVSGSELISYVSSPRSEPDDVSEEDWAVPRAEWYDDSEPEPIRIVELPPNVESIPETGPIPNVAFIKIEPDDVPDSEPIPVEELLPSAEPTPCRTPSIIHLADVYSSVATALPESVLPGQPPMITSELMTSNIMPELFYNQNVNHSEIVEEFLKGRLRSRWLTDDYELLSEELAEFMHFRGLLNIDPYQCYNCGNFFRTVNGRNNLHVRLGLCLWRTLIPCQRCGLVFESLDHAEQHECAFLSNRRPLRLPRTRFPRNQ